MAGVTMAPNDAYLKQVARNLTGVGYGFLLNCWYRIMGRDKEFTNDFRGHLDFGLPRIASIRRPGAHSVRTQT
jgi:hypothetical protein